MTALRSILAPIALATVALALAGCGQPEPESPPPRLALTAVVQARPLATATVFPGEVRARYETDLGFRIAGKIVERRIELGTAVKTGQPLARLDPQDTALAAAAARAQVAQAEAELAFAASELERARRLLAENFISRTAFDQRVSTHETALARRDAVRAQAAVSTNQAAYATLATDAPGIVTAVLAEVGQVVAAGQPVVRVARTEEKDVVIHVAEGQLPLLRAAPEARIALWAVADRQYAGRVREIAPAADPVTRTYLVKVAMRDPDADVRWGMTANVVFAPPEAGTPVLVVPATALFQQGDHPAVWVVAPDNRVMLRPVRVARFREDGVQLASGLADGETIVTAGVHKLREGQTIRPARAPGTS